MSINIRRELNEATGPLGDYGDDDPYPVEQSHRSHTMSKAMEGWVCGYCGGTTWRQDSDCLRRVCDSCLEDIPPVQVKPCPRCGATSSDDPDADIGVAVVGTADGEVVRIECEVCGLTLDCADMSSFEEAVVEWNCQPAIDSLRKRIAELEGMVRDAYGEGYIDARLRSAQATIAEDMEREWQRSKAKQQLTALKGEG